MISSFGKISVVMPAYNCEKYIKDAITSVLNQSYNDIELIVIDDNSSDNTLKIIEELASSDGRVIVQNNEFNLGPAKSRNKGLEIACGEWIAIIDSDDIIHSKRFEYLLSVAKNNDIEIIADDMLHFYEDNLKLENRINFLMEGLPDIDSFTVIDFIKANTPSSKLPALGYLKPIFKKSLIKCGLKYNENLVIAEDFDFLLRIMINGTKLWVTPNPMYFYRKHSNSISHRLSALNIKKMIDAQDQIERHFNGQIKYNDIIRALNDRRDALLIEMSFANLVVDLKKIEITSASRKILKAPRLLNLLLISAFEGLRSRLKRVIKKTSAVSRNNNIEIDVLTVKATKAISESDWPSAKYYLKKIAKSFISCDAQLNSFKKLQDKKIIADYFLFTEGNINV